MDTPDDPEDDLLSGLDFSNEIVEETDEEILAAFDSSNPIPPVVASNGPDPAPVLEEPWLTAIKEFAQSHRPFSTDQVVQIIRELNKAPSPAPEV